MVKMDKVSDKTDLKKFLNQSAFRGSPALGKPSLVSLLSDSHHSSARIMTVKTRSVERSIFVLKQIKTLRSPIFGKYLLKDGETCPEVIAGHNKALIAAITDEDPKDVAKHLEKQQEKDKMLGKEQQTTKQQKVPKPKVEAPKGFSFQTLPFEFCEQKMIHCDGADTLLESTEFLVEASVDYLIKNHVQEKIPYFLTSVDSWRSKRHGNILLRNAGFDMNSHFPFYGLLEIQAIVIQTMYAIAWAQKYIHLKHHDLHCGNVFIDGETSDSINLKFPEGTTLVLPAKMPKILIADYGLSSATDPTTKCRVTRADFHLMETSTSDDDSDNDKCSHSGPCDSSSKRSKKSGQSKGSESQSSDYSDDDDYESEEEESSSIDMPQSLLDTGSVSSETQSEPESESDSKLEEEEEENDWGEWTHELNPEKSKRHMGYDVACFVSNLQEEAEDRRHESLGWLNAVLSKMEELDPEFQLTRRGRPLTSSKFTIDELVKSIPFAALFKGQSAVATLSSAAPPSSAIKDDSTLLFSKKQRKA